MKKFLFKLNPLLKLRRNERDVRQQLLADVLRRDSVLVARRRKFETDREMQIDELRALAGRASEIDVDAAAARRHYAVQLLGMMHEIDVQRAALATKIEDCRQALIRADQAVKALEKLAEKQEGEFIFQQERLESRALEEAWQAIHAGERDPC
jgi:flagellar export protein FliJ